MLRCGHAYTLSTLDGCMGLSSVYSKVRVCLFADPAFCYSTTTATRYKPNLSRKHILPRMLHSQNADFVIFLLSCCGWTGRWQDEGSGRWTAPIPLASNCSVLKLCPDCRVPVEGVLRYKRVTNKAKVTKSKWRLKLDWCCTSAMRRRKTKPTVTAFRFETAFAIDWCQAPSSS